MAVDASWPLQRAIMEKLRTDDRVSRLLAGAPPLSAASAGAGQPRFLRVTSRAWHSATFDGEEHDIELGIDGVAGGPDIVELSAAVVAALHDADLPLPGHALIELEFLCSEMRERDGPAEPTCRIVFRALTVAD